MTMVIGMITPTARTVPAKDFVDDADAERGFTDTVRRLRQFVTRRARRLADGDHDLMNELAQEAWIKLWELDPLRYDLDDRNDRRFLRVVLSNRMRDVARKELRLRGGPEIVRLHVRLA